MKSWCTRNGWKFAFSIWLSLVVLSAPAISGAHGEPNNHETANGRGGEREVDYPQRYRQHIQQLRERLPNEDFNIVVEMPFVVVGDESLEKLRSRCKATIRFAVENLKNQYFKHDPEQIIDIWLFKDAKSYQKHVLELFGEKPGTPYGYYSARHRALIMDISTGGGTLVHEIVHPFIERNFPQCPSWFNEGLASLYEQCKHQNGQIWGLTNWRLKGLKNAIRIDSVPSFESLCETTRDEFYRDNRGVNYAQARYLCYFLQQQGKLNQFYKLFYKDIDRDPSGYLTLQRVLERDDMDKFKQEWEEYVMKLSYP